MKYLGIISLAAIGSYKLEQCNMETGYNNSLDNCVSITAQRLPHPLSNPPYQQV